MAAPEPGHLQFLPEPQAEFVFAVAGGVWPLATLAVAVLALAAAASWWGRRRRGRR